MASVPIVLCTFMVRGRLIECAKRLSVDLIFSGANSTNF